MAKANGFSLHAGVSCEGHQKEKVRAGTARETALGHKRERLCRYIARPAVAVPRLSLSATGKVVYTLKTPYRDGTTQVAFDPVDFIARLAALVPKPRVKITGTPSPATTASLLRTTAGVGRLLRPGAAKGHPPEPRLPRFPFSRGRARGSRTRFLKDQSAGTPLNHRLVWIPMVYGLKTTIKD